MKDLNTLGWVALALVLIGGINWGLVGLFGGNIVTGIFGDFLGRVIFVAVGAAAGYLCYLVYLAKFKKS